MNNDDYIKLRLKEENHKVIMANYYQPYKKEIVGPVSWRDKRPPAMVHYNPTPFDKYEIAKLFMEISQEIIKIKDIDWLEISAKIQPSPIGADTNIQIRIDLWEENNESDI